MKIALAILLFGFAISEQGFAGESISGQGMAYVQSSTNNGCEDLAPGSEEQATTTAQDRADANANQQCPDDKAERTGQYSLVRTIKYRGAGCLFTVTAVYDCAK